MKGKKEKRPEKKSGGLHLPKLEPAPKPPKEEPSEEKVNLRSDNSPLRLVGILCLLFAICGLILGLADLLTEERIAANQNSRNMGVLEEVLPYGENYREIRYTGVDPTVEAAYEAPGAGWVFQISPVDSFSGELTLMVGVDISGTVSGVAVVASGETDGLGARASEPEFRSQFTDRSGTVRVEADGGEIVAISQATITSRAVCAAVNSALFAAAELS